MEWPALECQAPECLPVIMNPNLKMPLEEIWVAWAHKVEYLEPIWIFLVVLFSWNNNFMCYLVGRNTLGNKSDRYYESSQFSESRGEMYDGGANIPLLDGTISFTKLPLIHLIILCMCWKVNFRLFQDTNLTCIQATIRARDSIAVNPAHLVCLIARFFPYLFKYSV